MRVIIIAIGGGETRKRDSHHQTTAIAIVSAISPTSSSGS